jgi:hypothetical protein
MLVSLYGPADADQVNSVDRSAFAQYEVLPLVPMKRSAPERLKRLVESA